MKYEAVEIVVDDGVGRIALNRPKARNALSNQLMDELIAALLEMGSNDDVRVVVVSGNGPVFCSGADLMEVATEEREHHPKDWHKHLERFLNVAMTMWDLKKPIVTAVHGAALGGGFDVALMGDITFCGDRTVFGLPEVKFLMSDLTLVLPWIVGMKKAKELLFTGDIDASEALDLGW